MAEHLKIEPNDEHLPDLKTEPNFDTASLLPEETNLRSRYGTAAVIAAVALPLVALHTAAAQQLTLDPGTGSGTPGDPGTDSGGVCVPDPSQLLPPDPGPDPFDPVSTASCGSCGGCGGCDFGPSCSSLPE
jgi:hypothetical protein